MQIRRIPIFGAALAFLICCACGQPGSSPDTSVIDALLRAAVESGQTPGVVAAAASHDAVLYQSAFGKMDLDSGVAIPADAIFQIASMTKAVTSVAVMQLAEQGKVSLDDPAYLHVEELKNVKVLDGFDAGGEPRLRDPVHPPTVRELLAHTGGYAYSFWNENIKRFEEGSKLPNGRERFANLPLAFDPGSQWGYGPNTDVLGILVETLSGRTLEEYFRERIFGPLKMPDTHFQASDGDWLRLPSRYQRAPDGGVGPAAMARPQTPPQVTFFSGGGASCPPLRTTFAFCGCC